MYHHNVQLNLLAVIGCVSSKECADWMKTLPAICWWCGLFTFALQLLPCSHLTLHMKNMKFHNFWLFWCSIPDDQELQTPKVIWVWDIKTQHLKVCLQRFMRSHQFHCTFRLVTQRKQQRNANLSKILVISCHFAYFLGCGSTLSCFFGVPYKF